MDFEKFSEDEKFVFSHFIGKTMPLPPHHYHNLFEIYFMEDGKCNYFIDNKSYEVLQGDVVLIPEGVLHKTTYDVENHARILINCSNAYIPKSVIPYIPKMMPLYRNPDISGEIYTLLKQIEEDYTNPDSFSADSIISRTNMLFLLLARHKNDCEKVISRNIHIEDIINYIRDNYDKPLRLSEISKKFGLSPEHISRTFKKETGFGFSEYVTLTRLKNAEVLLINERKTSISKIAFRCGFNDSNYFSVKFKNMYGVSPSEYVKLR